MKKKKMKKKKKSNNNNNYNNNIIKKKNNRGHFLLMLYLNEVFSPPPTDKGVDWSPDPAELSGTTSTQNGSLLWLPAQSVTALVSSTWSISHHNTPDAQSKKVPTDKCQFKAPLFPQPRLALFSHPVSNFLLHFLDPKDRGLAFARGCPDDETGGLRTLSQWRKIVWNGDNGPLGSSVRRKGCGRKKDAGGIFGYMVTMLSFVLFHAVTSVVIWRVMS